MKPLPASLEVQREAESRSAGRLATLGLLLDSHPCDTDDDDITLMCCPCGTTAVIHCPECGELLYVKTEPGTWCEHAAENAGEEDPWRPR